MNLEHNQSFVDLKLVTASRHSPSFLYYDDINMRRYEVEGARYSEISCQEIEMLLGISKEASNGCFCESAHMNAE